MASLSLQSDGCYGAGFTILTGCEGNSLKPQKNYPVAKRHFLKGLKSNVGMSRTGYSFLGWGQRAQRRVHALPRYNQKTNGSNKIPEHRSGRKPKFSFLEINEVPRPLVEQNWI